MGTELEYKYRVPDAETLTRILDYAQTQLHPLGEVEQIQMRTTYYDTADGALTGRRWTLRLRMENGVAVVTNKIPLPGGVRGEWEAEAPSVDAAIPALLRQGAPAELEQLISAGLREVCGAAFLRRALLLELSDGSRCELAADLGELLGETERLPLCELELELKDGEAAKTRLLGELLRARFGLEHEKNSKYARAKELK